MIEERADSAAGGDGAGMEDSAVGGDEAGMEDSAAGGEEQIDSSDDEYAELFAPLRGHRKLLEGFLRLAAKNYEDWELEQMDPLESDEGGGHGARKDEEQVQESNLLY